MARNLRQILGSTYYTECRLQIWHRDRGDHVEKLVLSGRVVEEKNNLSFPAVFIELPKMLQDIIKIQKRPHTSEQTHKMLSCWKMAKNAV